MATLRLLARAALEERTLAGGHVFDSRVEALHLGDEDRGDEAYAIVIFTDDAKGTDWREGALVPELTIEWFVSTLFYVDPEEGGEQPPEAIRDIAPTSAGLEFALNIMGAQILHALRNPANEAGDLLKRLCPAGESQPAVLKRGASERKGTRRAVAQFLIPYPTLHEPVLGAGAVGVWADICAAFEARPRYAGYGRSLRMLLDGDGSLPDEIAELMRGAAPDDRAAEMGLRSLGGTIESHRLVRE